MLIKFLVTCIVFLALLQGSNTSRDISHDRGIKAARKDFQGLTFSPQIKKVPGDTTPYDFTCMNAQYTDQSLNALLPKTNRIRLYSAICYEATVTTLARSAQDGFEVFMGLYGGASQDAFVSELNLFNQAYTQAKQVTGKTPNVVAVSVANEAILGNTMKVSQIKAYADICRSKLVMNPKPPIAVVDVPQVFDFYRQIIGYVDIIGVNIHPLYSHQCTSLSNCLKYVDGMYRKIKGIAEFETAKHHYKAVPHITITETGFSYNTIISKSNVGVIPGGMTNQGGHAFVETYMNQFLAQYRDYDYYWFEGILSDWKGVPANTVELGWGLVDRYIFYTQVPEHPNFKINKSYYATDADIKATQFGGYSHLVPINNSPSNLFDFTKEDGGAKYFNNALYQANLFKPE